MFTYHLTTERERRMLNIKNQYRQLNKEDSKEYNTHKVFVRIDVLPSSLEGFREDIFFSCMGKLWLTFKDLCYGHRVWDEFVGMTDMFFETSLSCYPRSYSFVLCSIVEPERSGSVKMKNLFTRVGSDYIYHNLTFLCELYKNIPSISCDLFADVQYILCL